MKIMINNGNLSNIFSIRDKTRQTGNVICLSIHNIFILFPISNHTLLYEFPIVLPTKNVMAIYLGDLHKYPNRNNIFPLL